MKETTKTLLYEWIDRKLPKIKPREINIDKYLTSNLNKILAVTGFRRTGKTYLLLESASKLIGKLSRKEIIYLNFEDERITLKTEFLTQLIPTIEETFGTQPKYLFLDEIQLIPDWSKWVRRIHETTDIKIVVTGSTAKMSSHEIPTELRGRFIEIKVLPINFHEFLSFKNFKYQLQDVEFRSKEKSLLLNLLTEYLSSGGLPEIVLADDWLKTEIAQSYYKTVVSLDIAERMNVRNNDGLKAMIKLLLNTQSITITKLHNNLNSENIQIGKNTVAEYLTFIENSYLFDFVTCFSFKIKEQLKHPRKCYCIDNSFITYISTKFSKNWGWYFENAVKHELTMPQKEIHYWKSEQNKYEIDFVVIQDDRVDELIQVCYDLSEEITLEREIRALLQASKELNCKKLTIITLEKETIETSNWFGTEAEIRFIPLWKWLLTN